MTGCSVLNTAGFPVHAPQFAELGAAWSIGHIHCPQDTVRHRTWARYLQEVSAALVGIGCSSGCLARRATKMRCTSGYKPFTTQETYICLPSKPWPIWEPEGRRGAVPPRNWAVDGQVLFDAFSRGRYAADASHYQIEPLGVVVPQTVSDVEQTLAIARKRDVPVLMRGGGTRSAVRPLARLWSWIPPNISTACCTWIQLRGLL